MKDGKSGADLKRRGFLLAGGTGAVGAVAVAMSPTSAPVTTAAKRAPVNGDAGYQESEHVRTYYDLARV